MTIWCAVGKAPSSRRAGWAIGCAVALSAALYAGYPYVTLYRLHAAVRGSDVATLRDLVDWDAVRASLKADLRDGMMGAHDANRRTDDLPPLGDGFVRQVAGDLLDRGVTPETLISLAGGDGPEAEHKARIAWAFFTAPTRFAVDVRPDGMGGPLRLEMALRGLAWRVERVRLPRDMLNPVGSGT